MRCIAFVSAGIAFVSADTNANLTAMNAFFFFNNSYSMWAPHNRPVQPAQREQDNRGF